MIRAMPFSAPVNLNKNANKKKGVATPSPFQHEIDPNLEWHDQNHHIWLDVCTPTLHEIALVRSSFEINTLALEDALEVGHWSRFEAYPQHITLILRTLAEPKACSDRTERVSYFWYPHQRALVTIHLEPVDYLSHIWRETLEQTSRTPDRIMAALLTSGAETFFDYTDALSQVMDDLEETVFVQRSQTEFTREIFGIKHQIMEVRRLVSGARESVASLSRHAQNSEMSIYFRDSVDSLSRVYDNLDSAREVLSSILDVHLTVQSNRMNEVMKTLTIVSTIFLPLTFLAGVWGMNFKTMPELEWPHGYTLALLTMAAVGVGFAVYFRKRGWW